MTLVTLAHYLERLFRLLNDASIDGLHRPRIVWVFLREDGNLASRDV